MSDSCHIELSHVSKSYKTPTVGSDLTIIHDLSLRVEKAEALIITGESGSGKTTLLNILGGLDTLDSGSIRVDDIMVSDLQEHQMYHYRQHKLGFIFQFHHLLRDFTALENTMLAARIAGRRDAEEQAMRLLQRVGLEDRIHNYPYQLSGGERQRVAITRALINEPTLILADEPTGSLDEQRSREIETMLFNLVREENRTMIIVTHDTRLAALGDRHLHLTLGRLE